MKAAFKQGQLFKAGDANIFAKEEIKYRNKNYKVYVISVKDGITVNGISTDKLWFIIVQYKYLLNTASGNQYRKSNNL